ncbi:acyl-CoA N-acyltransferase [Viridothelium virens]|uniref:Acyl-CoA N-acyltransferase n=1 Tax=Viridothelium virens TaxID=1048519 RepID=A0A6A6HHD9_VIRVR|nr:acyl-CoA N-acyltransferase [Viridothelium virens]
MSSDSMSPAGKQFTQVIYTERLILRRLCATDAEYLLPILSNPDSMQWLNDTVRRRTIQGTQEWIDERLARPGLDTFLVELLSTTQATTTDHQAGKDVNQEGSFREVIGVIGSPDIPRIGYIFHAKYFGKGYATEALKAYMNSYWNRVPPVSSGESGSFDFACAATDVDNTPSRRLLEKCGFSLQRIGKESYDNPSKGGLRDDAVYAIFRPGTHEDGASLLATDEWKDMSVRVTTRTG